MTKTDRTISEKSQRDDVGDVDSVLLGPSQIRDLASKFGVRPTKALGQNFVHDAGTVRRIVQLAEVTPQDSVLEIGPGLGSLTLGLLEAGAYVCAVEIDATLANALEGTAKAHLPQALDRLHVIHDDAMNISRDTFQDIPIPQPQHMVANLPYNVAVPVLLTVFERFSDIDDALVMVQAEVADRLAAGPGSKIYGIPSVKISWYGTAKRTATIGRGVFWPVPNVDSALVQVKRRHEEYGDEALRRDTFAVVDRAFGQRRKMLRAALRDWMGGPDRAEALCEAAGVSPQIRGEVLTIDEFVELGRHLKSFQAPSISRENDSSDDQSRQSGQDNLTDA